MAGAARAHAQPRVCRARSSARTSSPPPPSQSWAPSVAIEFFNLYETAGRLVLDEHPPFTGAEARERSGPAVLIVADQAIAEVLVVNVARLWRNSRAHSRAKIEITLGGPGAEAESRPHPRALPGDRRRSPTCSRGRSTSARPNSASRTSAARPPPLRRAGGRGEGGGHIADDRLNPLAANPVVLIVNDERAGSLAIAGVGTDAGPVRLFGILDLVLDERFLVGGLQETLAKEIHLYYYRKELAKGGEKLPYVKPWKKLDDDAKSSNRDSAADIPRKLAGSAAWSSPRHWPTPSAQRRCSRSSSTDRLEEFAKAEHERWIAERGRNGWKLGPKRDNDAKIHPSMKPYTDLTEPEKEKDRDMIRKLPEQLAMAGFAIERKPVATGSAPAPPR